MNWLLRLYPAPWRKRYGEEFAAVLAGQRASIGLVLDVLAGAIDARLHPQVRDAASNQTTPNKTKGDDTMTIAMLQRCAAGGPKLSPRDQRVASIAMLVSAGVMTVLYLVLTKLYHSAPAVQAIGYATPPALSLIYAQTAYLRKRPRFTQILLCVAGFIGMYLFMLITCVIADKL